MQNYFYSLLQIILNCSCEQEWKTGELVIVKINHTFQKKLALTYSDDCEQIQQEVLINGLTLYTSYNQEAVAYSSTMKFHLVLVRTQLLFRLIFHGIPKLFNTLSENNSVKFVGSRTRETKQLINWLRKGQKYNLEDFSLHLVLQTCEKGHQRLDDQRTQKVQYWY